MVGAALEAGQTLPGEPDDGVLTPISFSMGANFSGLGALFSPGAAVRGGVTAGSDAEPGPAAFGQAGCTCGGKADGGAEASGGAGAQSDSQLETFASYACHWFSRSPVLVSRPPAPDVDPHPPRQRLDGTPVELEARLVATLRGLLGQPGEAIDGVLRQLAIGQLHQYSRVRRAPGCKVFGSSI